MFATTLSRHTEVPIVTPTTQAVQDSGMMGDGVHWPPRQLAKRVCVYYCSTYYKAVRVGGGEDMCYERRRAEACVD
jgi:hypothetical protein